MIVSGIVMPDIVLPKVTVSVPYSLLAVASSSDSLSPRIGSPLVGDTMFKFKFKYLFVRCREKQSQTGH